jgi:hypothetical protein
MHDLVEKSIAAHAGLARWNPVLQISATLKPDGLALKLRGQEDFAKSPTRVTIDTRVQLAAFDPFLVPGLVGIFAPYRTALQTTTGGVMEELKNPRDSFKQNVPWTAPQLAYFVGYALWTYLTLPFSLLTDGVDVEEVEPWTEDGETWRALKVSFPESYVTHSSEQILYLDDKGLMRRQDYAVDIAAGGTAAHYIHDYKEFDGIVFPTRRRIYSRAGRQPNKDVVLMAADLSDFKLSGTKPFCTDSDDFRTRFDRCDDC